MNVAQGHAWFLQAELFAANSECAECKPKILRLEDAQVDHLLRVATQSSQMRNCCTLIATSKKQQAAARRSVALIADGIAS